MDRSGALPAAPPVRVGSQAQQESHHLVVSAEGSAEEWRLAVGVDALDVDTFPQQVLDPLGPPGEYSQVEFVVRLLVCLLGPHMLAGAEAQGAHWGRKHLELTADNSLVKCVKSQRFVVFFALPFFGFFKCVLLLLVILCLFFYFSFFLTFSSNSLVKYVKSMFRSFLCT